MRNDSLLQQAYSTEEFQKDAIQVMDMITKQLQAAHSVSIPKTIDYISPEEHLQFWKKEFNSSHPIALLELLEKLESHSINFHSKGYAGHQVAVTLPLTALTSAITAYLNNCTTVYELGMAGNAMEKVVIEYLSEKYGYEKGSTGFVASGGSIGNLTALVTARTSSGIPENEFSRLAIMVSEEAHYSVSRAASIMGIRSENIIKVPVDTHYSIRTDLLESLYHQAVSDGKLVFCVIGCACTTSVGAHDNLAAIADFSEKHQIWFHVDGAHGGAAIFSDKYKYLLRGIDRSDSLIVDFHKMMMAPPLSTAILYNRKNREINEFSPKAAYLWQDQLSEEWYNSAKHTFECTKPITILHTYAIMRVYGEEIYRENVDTLYDMGQHFAEMIQHRQNIELAMEPLSNIVCFRYRPQSGDIGKINQAISAKLLQDGTYYVVNTMVHGEFYIRATFMNPLTDDDCLEKLLDKVQEFGIKAEFQFQ